MRSDQPLELNDGWNGVEKFNIAGDVSNTPKATVNILLLDSLSEGILSLSENFLTWSRIFVTLYRTHADLLLLVKTSGAHRA